MIRVEFLYDIAADITRIYVWRGMRLLEQQIIEGQIDAYERDGIVEEKRKENKNAKSKR